MKSKTMKAPVKRSIPNLKGRPLLNRLSNYDFQTAPRVAITCVLVAATTSFFAACVEAAPPKLDHLFPAGLTVGQEREIIASGGISNWPPKVWTNAPNVTVTPQKAKGKLKFQATADAKPGLYFLRLIDAEGASTARPFILSNLPAVEESDSNNTIDGAHAIDSPSVVDGKLEKAGDVDVFAVSLKKGQTLVASVAANWMLGSPMDPVLQITDHRGFVMEQIDDEIGFDPRIAFTAPKEGKYCVRLFAFPATPNSTIRFAGASAYIYRLTLTTGPFIDSCQPMSFEPGKDQQFQLIGWNIESLKQKQLAQASDSDSVMLSAPDAASFVSVHSSAAPVKKIVESDQPTAIQWPLTFTGCIDDGESADEFTFNVEKSQRLRFAIESDSLGYRLDPVIRLFNGEGAKVLQVDDTNSLRDCVAFHTFKTAGEHRLQIRDLAGDGGLRFAYRCTIDDSPPGFTLTAASDSFSVKPGEALKIPVTVVREKGCSDLIEIAIDKLPGGAKCAPVKSEPKGASAKTVTLEVTSDQTSPGGSFRIIGTATRTQNGEDSAVAKAATFTITGTMHTLRDFWLHVPEKAK